MQIDIFLLDIDKEDEIFLEKKKAAFFKKDLRK